MDKGALIYSKENMILGYCGILNDHCHIYLFRCDYVHARKTTPINVVVHVVFNSFRV